MPERSPTDAPAGDGPSASTGEPAHEPTDAQRTARGVRIGLAVYAIWGLLTIYWKQLGDFAATELIAWRMVCAGIVMALVVTARRSWPTVVGALRDRAILLRLTVAAVLLTANWGSYVWAVVNERVIETALGYFMAPLATMAIGVFVLGETPSRAQRVAFTMVAAAVVFLSVAGGQPPWVALVIAATWSLYGLTKRQIGLDPIDSLAGETLVLLAPAAAILIAISGRAGTVATSASPRDWLFVAGTGVITAVPLMMFASAAKAVPFTLLGPLNLLVPVINFVLGWLFYDEAMPLDRFIGYSIVWAALVVVISDGLKFRNSDKSVR